MIDSDIICACPVPAPLLQGDCNGPYARTAPGQCLGCARPVHPAVVARLEADRSSDAFLAELRAAGVL